MEEDRFWDLVAQLRAGGEDTVRQARRVFAAMNDGDLAGFADRWHAVKDRADRLPLVEAVAVAFGHAGEDAFSALRDRLICRGHEVYDRVLAGPDSLVEILGPSEPFAPALWEALSDRPWTKELMAYRAPAPVRRGTLGDPADLRARYPRCAAARDAYLRAALPTVAVPLDPDRRTRSLSLGATWAPRRRRTD